MNSYILKLLQVHQQELLREWKKDIHSIEDPNMEPFKKDDALNEKIFELVNNSIQKYDTERFSELRKFYIDLMEKDWSLNYLTAAFQIFRRNILKILLQVEPSREQILSLYEEVDGWFDPVVTHLVNDCSERWQSTYRRQQEELDKLTAPMIPVFRKACILPLIGNISDDRAGIIKENLLKGIAQFNSEYVLIDVTGVPVVDTYVANHFMQATEAASLLGTECIIVGIRPEIAQTLTSLGITFNIMTFSDLHKGVQYVLQKSK
ncbi:STAS domain-containing protein [Pseudobacillus wudalianchiensis]|uniref:STAS domain-containing protein n=1 Tax=Pseudobacillus wudalianchiensis TaxID=1743143 RepID=A0A1B9B9X9_9BACI|nr:STAS domain-containing protein [Bacillus wudalianchiensis]OCA92871.1 hypothetical protein A8F95_04080 [Bacillus wudalianchiensis]